jgi:predicted SnoaL-like aldol condensation-catalyzing enzyme
METEHNKATAQRWSEDLWGRANLAVADEIIAADYQRHDPGDPFPARGPADVKRIVTILRMMLPDLQIHVDAIIAEGDIVVSRYTTTATDTIGYMGMAPSGKTIRAAAMQMFRFADGKLVESWAVRDDLGVLKQLGQWSPRANSPR